MTTTSRKKLIEVAIPLDSINQEAAHRKRKAPTGYPTSIHKWWAQRPIAACRAVIFCSLVDDPSNPNAPRDFLVLLDQLGRKYSIDREDAGSGTTDASHRRNILFRFIDILIKWDSSSDQDVLKEAEQLILASTNGVPPLLIDPFAGGGSIPLEAQRLGLDVHASDLNTVATLISKSLVAIPPQFADMPPVYDTANLPRSTDIKWAGAAGLAQDIRHYGSWMASQAQARIGHLYHTGKENYPAVAWLWARTLPCPNPTCGTHMPLLRTLHLSKTNNAWLHPVPGAQPPAFEVMHNQRPTQKAPIHASGATCIACGDDVSFDTLRRLAQRHGFGVTPLAAIEQNGRRRHFRNATDSDVALASCSVPDDLPVAPLPDKALGFRIQSYGMTSFTDMFTPRQLRALSTFVELISVTRARVLADARNSSSMSHSHSSARERDEYAPAYADAIATYLAFAVDRMADYNSSFSRWLPKDNAIANTFGSQSVPMVWDFVEASPFGKSSASFEKCVSVVASAVEKTPARGDARVLLADAADMSASGLIVTDPPYYGNIGYADLSDFFYIWLRRMVGDTYPDEFGTLLTAKSEELIATPFRFGGDKAAAERHFESGLQRVFEQCRLSCHPEFPLSIFYAYKQTEKEDGKATSTGWDTMLSALLRTGFQITGTWPMRTEMSTRLVASGTNALASSVVIVCRPRPEGAPLADRRQFVKEMEQELNEALDELIGGHIAPVDLQQSSIGPGMAIFSRFSGVIEDDGSHMSVRTALGLINRSVDEYFSQRDGSFDADTQFCARWFEEYGFGEGPFGVAHDIALAKNIAIEALAHDGLLTAGDGVVTLNGWQHWANVWEEWDPIEDRRLTAWEACHCLAAALRDGGARAAGSLARRLGPNAEPGRDLAYRLYSICDARGWNREARDYNVLADSWTDIQRAAAQIAEGQQASF